MKSEWREHGGEDFEAEVLLISDSVPHKDFAVSDDGKKSMLSFETTR